MFLLLKPVPRTKSFSSSYELKICSNARESNMHNFLTPWPVPTLCLESLPEMEKSMYPLTLQPVGKIWQRVLQGKSRVIRTPSGSQDELHVIPA